MNQICLRNGVGALAALLLGLPALAGAQEVEAPPPEEASVAPAEEAVIDDHAAWREALQLTLTGRLLEDDSEYMLDVLFPVWRQALRVNLRGTLLEDREQELNAGLVFRQPVFSDRVLVGANLYGDFRWTENDHQYEQVGVGLEVLSRWVDARANYYYPLTDETVLAESVEEQITRSGRTLTETATTLRSFEEALEGYDVEAGVWLPVISKVVPAAVYGGYYQFDSDWVDDDPFGGWKARVELHLHPLLILDAEWFEEDALNRSDYIVGARVRIPLGGEGLQAPHTAGPYFLTAAARLDDMVYRDFRIRTIETGPVSVSSSVNQTTLPAPPPPEPELPPPPEPELPPPPEPELVCRDEFVVDPITGLITTVTICE